MTARWNRQALEALGPVTEVPVAAQVLEVSEWTIYEAIRRDTWTLTRVLRIGRKIKIPTYDLITLLYGAGPAPEPAAATVPKDITTDESSPLRAVQARD